MPKTKAQKKQNLEALQDKFDRMKSLVIVDYKGINVPQVTELRQKCQEQDSEYLVAKKTLIDLALKKSDMSDIDVENLEGNIALVFGFGDEVTPAKIVSDFSKKEEVLDILGGILENKFIPKDQVIALAKIPAKDELMAKVVGTIKAPISGFVNVLSGNIRGLVNVLNGIKESK